MYSTGVGLVLKGFENKLVSNINKKGDDNVISEKKPNSLLAKFTSFFEDEIE